jgi:hypothetical protein
LIIVVINNLLEAVYAFYEFLPLLASRFKFNFDLESVMIFMLSVKHKTIHAEEFLSVVLTRFYIAVEDLDVSSVAWTLYIIRRRPVVHD